MRSADTYLFKLPLILLSIVVGLVLVELGYRAFVGLGTVFGIVDEPVVPAELGRFDPALGWALVPGSRAISHRVGRVEYAINAKGLRDDEHAYAKPAGTSRIVIVGDSRTFGFGVPIEKHFTRLIEGYCAATEVVNMGVSGFGVDQELLFLEGEGLKYQPDLVIAYVAHFGNHRHMHSNRFGASKPKFELDDDALVMTHRPESMPEPFYAGSLVLREAFDKLAGLSGDVRELSDQADAANAKDEVFMNELYRLAIAIIDRMRTSAASAGAHFLLVTHVHQLERLAAERSIDVLNVRLALNNELFALPDGLRHINEAGNGVLAWEIVRAIRARQALGPGSDRLC